MKEMWRELFRMQIQMKKILQAGPLTPSYAWNSQPAPCQPSMNGEVFFFKSEYQELYHWIFVYEGLLQVLQKHMLIL